MLIDVPTYRNDVTLPADLVEEVARITGYDLIPETLLEGGLPPQEVNRPLELEEHIKDIMVACGLDEVMPYTVAYSVDLEKLARLEGASGNGGTDGSRPSYRSWDTSRRPVTIFNPVSSKQDVMRPTLLPNLLATLSQNVKMLGDDPIGIFELGKVFLTPTEEEISSASRSRRREAALPRLQAWEPVPNEERLPVERRQLTAALTGFRYPKTRWHMSGDGQEAYLDFFDAKGVVEELLKQLHISDVQYLPADAPMFHPGRVALIRSGDIDLGVVGELHPTVVEEWELNGQRVAVWDLSIEAITRAMPDRYRYMPVSPYAPVTQDMAFVMPEDTPAGVVADLIQKAGGKPGHERSPVRYLHGEAHPRGFQKPRLRGDFQRPRKATHRRGHRPVEKAH